jgi:hypothetical protein
MRRGTASARRNAEFGGGGGRAGGRAGEVGMSSLASGRFDFIITRRIASRWHRLFVCGERSGRRVSQRRHSTIMIWLGGLEVGFHLNKGASWTSVSCDRVPVGA